MQGRLARAVADVPELAPYEPGLAGIFAEVGEVTEELSSQRVHGDLHLGQTLRTSLGWKLVDFEGEPAKPLPERVLPDSPWRDVAGMLRSFDYAARSVAKDAIGTEDEVHQRAYRGDEWVARNRHGLLAGYADQVGELTEGDLTLVRAYEADKAVYEVVYEARNRPGWIDIPLGAIARLTTDRLTTEEEQ
jgi:maltokinase